MAPNSVSDVNGRQKAEELDLLQGAVSIYSPSLEEENASKFLVEEMARRGFRAFRDEVGNAVGILGDGEKRIAFLGHIDTVRGQFDVRIEDNKLYGRGAVDAKGTLCAFICAATRLEEAGRLREKTLIVIGAVEEEAATSKGARYAMTQFQPDFCINGEPSGWDAITLGYKGRLLAKYFLRLPMTHTASGAKSACERGFEFWQSVQQGAAEFNTGKSGFERLDPSLRRIHSDSDGNYEHVDLWMGFRLPVGFDVSALKRNLLEIAGEGQLQFSGEETAVRMGKSNALVRAFLKSIRSSGGDPKFKVKTGTSDMNVVAPHWTCPMVAYGPGDSTLDHTPQEHLELEEYFRSIEILEKVLVEL
ncbi:MAG: [LysW]-lysine hydrolase [Acidobacteriia bacterium]|nr:[LysW]-lysine hydrolase [Terriglobia bacterium]